MSENKPPRNVKEVYKQIKPIIIDSNPKLVEELDTYIKDLVYTAPENLDKSYVWIPFLNILNSYYDEIDEDTSIKLKTILENKDS